MKVLVLIILLNAQTGDIEQSRIVGVADTTIMCQGAAAVAIEEDVKNGLIGDRVPFPVCIDIEPMIPREAKKAELREWAKEEFDKQTKAHLEQVLQGQYND